jgi:hypothetical protein
MKLKTLLSVASLTLVATFTSPARADDTAKAASTAAPNADTILRQTSDKLAAAKHFSFKATREVAADVAAGNDLQARSEVNITVQRPSHLVGSSASQGEVRHFYFDGKNFTLLLTKENMYSTVPVKTSLDALPVELAETYGVVPPLADFVVSDLYKDFHRRAKAIAYAGMGTFTPSSGGTAPVECHRLALSGTVADSELWIGVGDHLPRKLTATIKGGATPEKALTIEFLEWNMAAPVNDQMFVFTPPAGAKKIRMVTMDEMHAPTQTKP